ncbi:MAG TPA: hypothetical protein PLX98_08140, partial [Candidatus Aminicenantes bacterium]|nr:hypothetical protein [Candidatus Aminicenantes bacterium]
MSRPSFLEPADQARPGSSEKLEGGRSGHRFPAFRDRVRGGGPSVDIERLSGFQADGFGQGEAFEGLDPHDRFFAGEKAVDTGNLASRIEPVEPRLQAVDFPEGFPGGLSGV